jgi:glutamine amidotransferase
MCRLVAYLGHDVLLEDVLVKPSNSIVMQSLNARESSVRTNGDGFGLGWYAPSIDDTPALFRSIYPAWNDSNLLNLTAKIKSPCFFAHVRAASEGGVTHYNCHPFVHGSWMLMHNGGIYDFIRIKRHLRRLLDDDIYNWIQGETDSEHLFALFIQTAKGRNLQKLSVVAEVVEETFAKIADLIERYAEPGPNYFNLCLTDGRRFFVTRYCSDKTLRPESMHYSVGSRFVAKKGRFHMMQEEKQHGSLIISSEKLTNFRTEWHDVEENHLLMIDTDLSIQTQALSL